MTHLELILENAKAVCKALPLTMSIAEVMQMFDLVCATSNVRIAVQLDIEEAIEVRMKS